MPSHQSSDSTSTTSWKVAALLLPSLLLAGTAIAAQDEQFTRTTTIQVPGNPLAAFDISWVDPVLDLYALADRSNAAVDVFDTSSNTFVYRVGGFVGVAASGNDHSGPDGIVVVQHREIWAGDGDSTVKVIDLMTRSIV